ncbi:hypothetical protein HMPREF1408_01223 [Helicobacter pylori GAM245Ai]|uniref:Uncharacterized protein n=1 Tax=Helicobacter pylori GAM265BSii TaxID=1159049 RepID=M3NMJ0_HELPX|nr:hypothetical protein HPGAM_02890 [Helicobacter pylori Gambia94/24]EMG84542.1 hypothetical protein HMPREF1394_00161 [Helicobacter pylori GAM105Ai]EMG86474.1 hypothetical protein HMPREF1396_01063 [Helicobacter pylori GAM114Ai]EMG86873.1 hypothetical protein HMPREF1395_01187 [Helicobacter pylori GAM112Ai]EMG92162.1 hypothetical protein HMPREF1400_01614 [Helicobacter pylori GAM119Bi]EMG96501.1 hypothetical protein HMPREF1402_01593 [Helicobacter pylori GAM121Aii]EMG98215.1 hypothetical protein 
MINILKPRLYLKIFQSKACELTASKQTREERFKKVLIATCYPYVIIIFDKKAYLVTNGYSSTSKNIFL